MPTIRTRSRRWARRTASSTRRGSRPRGLFGGNSNWRGPVWFPLNYLLIEALDRYHLFYGDDLKVECPTGSGQYMTLSEVARELERRLSSIFLPDASGARPVHRRRPAICDAIRTGRISCCSTSISTATPGAAWARAIRRDGRRSSCAVSRAGRARRRRGRQMSFRAVAANDRSCNERGASPIGMIAIPRLAALARNDEAIPPLSLPRADRLGLHGAPESTTPAPQRRRATPPPPTNVNGSLRAHAEEQTLKHTRHRVRAGRA